MSSAPRILDHAGIVVSNLAASQAFYAAALRPLGMTLLYEKEGGRLAFGVPKADDFGVTEGEPVTHNAHIAFVARDAAAVDAFYAAAMAAGGRDNGAPGFHREYHPTYYAAFVLDPDGNNVEAVFHGL